MAQSVNLVSCFLFTLMDRLIVAQVQIGGPEVLFCLQLLGHATLIQQILVLRKRKPIILKRRGRGLALLVCQYELLSEHRQVTVRLDELFAGLMNFTLGFVLTLYTNNYICLSIQGPGMWLMIRHVTDNYTKRRLSILVVIKQLPISVTLMLNTTCFKCKYTTPVQGVSKKSVSISFIHFGPSLPGNQGRVTCQVDVIFLLHLCFISL